MYSFGKIFREQTGDNLRNMRLKVADISELLNGVDDGGGQQNVSLQTIFISTNGDYHAKSRN